MVKKPVPALSVVVPAYNEESRLPATLARLSQYLRKRKKSYEIIVVDDGSKDGTSAAVLQASRKDPSIRLIDNVFNLGKGASVRNGVMEARAEAILFTDADLSTPIEELERLLPRLSEADLVIGSRALAGSQILKRQPLYRVAMGKTFNFFVRLLAVRGIHDTQCGFKLMTRTLGQKVFPLQRVPRFGFDVEMCYLARKFGYRIAEVPVAWENSPDSTVNPVADASQMFFDLVQIRLNDWQGKYREQEGKAGG
jgi:dolichyl-phosphate beta-glucosyltransferase